MQRTLVFGKNGQVASELRERVGGSSQFKFLARDEIPVGDFGQLEKLAAAFRPQVMINCAAYTAVDKAESEREACFALNRDFVGHLAKISNAVAASLIHFSTDYIFDGTATHPYKETDRPGPLSVYGESKLAGESEILKTAQAATILRTSWVYSKYGSNFVKTIGRLANSEKELRVVDDQRGTPTWAGELAEFILNHLGERRAGVKIYNFSGEGETTWNGFAREIASIWQTRQREIVRIPTSDYPTPAKRPLYGVLSKEKLKAEFGFEILDWRESLRHSFKEWGRA